MTLGVTNEVNPKSNRAPRKPPASAFGPGAGSRIVTAGRSASMRAVPASASAMPDAAVAAGPNGSAARGPNGSAARGPKGSASPKRPASPNGSAAPAPNAPAGRAPSVSVLAGPYESGRAPSASGFAA